MGWKIVAAISVLSIAVSSGSVSAQAHWELGVGNIVDTLDYTTESFNVYRFLKDHPIQLGSRAMEPRLIDYPGESHYAITGVIGSTIEHKTATHTTLFLDQESLASFDYSHELAFTLWRDGRKLKVISSTCSGETEKTNAAGDLRKKFDDLRYLTLSACLDSARNQIVSALSSAEGGQE